MRVPAPAKINLHLRVGPPRGDGFHPLLTWIVTVGLFDTLMLVRKREFRAQPVRGTGEQGPPDPNRRNEILTLSSDHPSLPCDGRNLVVRAATALADHVRRIAKDATDRPIGRDATGTERRLDPVSAYLNKRIPPGAGLGGGSSDAAAALRGLDRLWKLDLSLDELSALGASLGSDVPFFLGGSSSICAGRGEIVRLTAPPDICRWVVLALPKIELSTPAVYRRFDELNLGSSASLDEEPDWSAWAKMPAAELVPRLRNDLEPAAFALRPELGELRQELERRLGRMVRMSGSGSSLFTLCDAGDEAATMARQAREDASIDAIAVPIEPMLQMI